MWNITGAVVWLVGLALVGLVGARLVAQAIVREVRLSKALGGRGGDLSLAE